ncbi:MAG: hypothetical protein J7599_10425 [Niabella sp.]|nr:hypothetical protein [Niabella sp.]
MKKIYTLVLALALLNAVSAQTADPAVVGATVTPAPGLLNGPGKFSFNFQNLGDGQLGMVPTSTSIKVTLNRLAPVLNAGVPQITGAGADYFDWTYNAGTKTITGVQNKIIPASTDVMNPVGGPVIIDVVFIQASTPAEAQAKTGNGANVNVQPGIGGNADQVNDNVSAYTYTDGALPVAFGFTSASFTGGKLKVDWETFSEKNNKSFIIEASKDGETFVEIDQVSTQAADGNSSEQIKYTYSKSWQEIAAKFGFSPLQLAIMALLVISVVVSAKRARKGAMLGSLVLLITIGIGCRKEDRDLDKLDQYPTTFVRIGQVNKDGTTVNYSKVVKVVAE